MIAWTPAQVRQLQVDLAGKWDLVQEGRLSPTAFSMIEQKIGYNFLPHGLLLSDMAEISNLPDSAYFDWMHTICASGGVAQYEVNAFIHRIRGLSDNAAATAAANAAAKDEWLQKLDKFKEAVVFPKNHGNVTFSFVDRFVAKPTAHVRAFASETICMVMVLGLFCQVVLMPRGLLPAECECFLLLGRIIMILSSNMETMAKVQLLHRLVLQHHDKFIILYPGCAKIKVHWLLHIAFLIMFFKRKASCFVTERKHKESKGIARFAYYKWTDTMTRRSLKNFFVSMAKPDVLAMYSLQNPRDLDVTMLFRQEQYALEILQLKFLKWSASMRTPRGTVTKSDLVMFCQDGRCHVGFAKNFYQATDGTLWMVVNKLPHAQAIVWNRRPAITCVIKASDILKAYPYFCSRGKVYLVMGMDSLLESRDD